VYQRYWSDTVDDMDRKRRKQAEFLVYRHCPWSLICEIAVLNERAKTRVEGILANFDATRQRNVVIRSAYYY
jgi:hypothetical protein